MFSKYLLFLFLNVNIFNDTACNIEEKSLKKPNSTNSERRQKVNIVYRHTKKTARSIKELSASEFSIRPRAQGHVNVMKRSTPFRTSSDAFPLPSPFSRQDELTTPSTSQERSIGSIIAHRDSIFDSIALDVSYAGLMSETDLVDSAVNRTKQNVLSRQDASDSPLLWEDIGVVDYLEKKLGPPDESTPEERVETLREILAERTEIHEGDGSLSDFLFHVARTKHGKIYIRVIRTLLLNRGKLVVKLRQLFDSILVVKTFLSEIICT